MDALNAQKYYIENSLNNINLQVIEDNGKYYFEELTEGDFDFDEIVSIEDIGYLEDDCVWDLETINGTFQAGVGSMIVKNTDSVFCTYTGLKEKIDLKDKEQVNKILKECFEIGDVMAEGASKLFKQPIMLEFEKVYLPFFSFGKKIYAGIMYEPPNYKKGILDKKGIVLKRRDNPNITKIVYKGMLDILFSEGEVGITRAIQFLHDKIESILDFRTPMEDLILTKTYKSDYKNENIPHKVLAERMFKRDPGNAPAFNERVPYVFIDVKNKNALQYERIEHPEYVVQNNLKIDCLFYIKQIENPITQILQTFMPKKEISKIFNDHINTYELAKSGQPKITKFFKKK